MINEVLPSVAELFSSVIGLFVSIYENFGAVNILFGAFLVYSIYRFLLQPLLGGGAGSDSVKKDIQKNVQENS